MSDRAYYENKIKDLKRKKANVESSIIRVQSMLDNDKFPKKNGKKPLNKAKEIETKEEDELEPKKKKGYFGL